MITFFDLLPCRKKYVAVALLLFSFSGLFAQSDIWVQKTNFDGELSFGVSSFVIGSNAQPDVENNVPASQPGNPQKDLWKYPPSLLSYNKFQKSYGGTNFDTDSANIAFASPTPDGGYIISSTTKSFGNGGNDSYVLKVSAAGIVQWAKTFGTAGNEISASVRPTSDGGYILAGETRKSLANADMLVMKISGFGALQWNKTLGGTQLSRANYAEETQAGGEYLIVGKGEMPGGNNTCLVKLGVTGNQVLGQNIPVTSGIDEGYSLAQTASGNNYMMAGNMMAGATNIDAYLVALNNSGNIVPGARVRFASPGSGTDIRSQVRQTADGGFIICGSSNGTGTHGGFDFFLLKVHSDLTISWGNIYGGPADDMGRAIAITAEGNFAVAGFTKSYGSGTDAFLALIDSDGTPLWTKVYGGSGVDKANSVYQTDDAGYVICGETFSFSTPSSASDIYLIKTDSLGNSGCNEASVATLPFTSIPFSIIPVSGSGPQPMATTSVSLTQTTSSVPANPLCSQCTFSLVKAKTNVKCNGDSTGSAAVGVAGGSSPYTYMWFTTGATTSAVSGLAAGTYVVVVSDANSCTAIDTIKILQPPLPLKANLASGSMAICSGGYDTLMPAPSGGTSPYSFSWSPSAGLSCTTCQYPIVNPSGNITYLLSLFDANSCMEKDSVQVTVLSPPNWNAGTDKSICGNTPALIGSPPAGGVYYSWSPVTGLNNASIANPFANPIATTTYIVTASDSAGCSKKDTVVVSVIAAPVINITAASYTMCTGIASDTLMATNFTGANYTWGPGVHPNNDTIIVGPGLTAGPHTYTVAVSNGLGCSGTASVTINVSQGFATPTVTPNPANYCFGNPIQPFTCTNPVTFVGWTDLSGNPLQFGTAFTPTVTAVNSYTYLCVQGNGKYCLSFPAFVVITIHPLPVADAGKNVTVCPGHTAALQASGGTAYLWSPDSALSAANIFNPSASPDSTFSYQVLVTDANGCKDRDSVTVFVIRNDTCKIHVFNVITPNSDGFNEGWWIDGIASYPDNTVTIFNRWGTPVWKGKNYDNKKVVWKGQNDAGDLLPTGTYYYVIHIKNTTYSKWVELVR